MNLNRGEIRLKYCIQLSTVILPRRRVVLLTRFIFETVSVAQYRSSSFLLSSSLRVQRESAKQLPLILIQTSLRFLKERLTYDVHSILRSNLQSLGDF